MKFTWKALSLVCVLAVLVGCSSSDKKKVSDDAKAAADATQKAASTAADATKEAAGNAADATKKAGGEAADA
ncbi:MAG TPA: hypothetical protein VK473_04055, partial [Terriglobales bacterium]|nr:hypothetical protein [Terriglobales bacterium]